MRQPASSKDQGAQVVLAVAGRGRRRRARDEDGLARLLVLVLCTARDRRGRTGDDEHLARLLVEIALPTQVGRRGRAVGRRRRRRGRRGWGGAGRRRRRRAVWNFRMSPPEGTARGGLLLPGSEMVPPPAMTGGVGLGLVGFRLMLPPTTTTRGGGGPAAVPPGKEMVPPLSAGGSCGVGDGPTGAARRLRRPPRPAAAPWQVLADKAIVIMRASRSRWRKPLAAAMAPRRVSTGSERGK